MEEANEIAKELYSIKNAICSNFQAIIYFDEPFYSLTVFVELYLLWNISKIINDKIILIIGVNVILFYSLIDKKYIKYFYKINVNLIILISKNLRSYFLKRVIFNKYVNFSLFYIFIL